MKLSIFNVDPTTVTLRLAEGWTPEQHGGWLTLECMTLSRYRPDDMPTREEITFFVEDGEALARLALVLSKGADAILAEAHEKVRAAVEARRAAYDAKEAAYIEQTDDVLDLFLLPEELYNEREALRADEAKLARGEADA